MTEHLPECPCLCTDEAYCLCYTAECICDALRACEARVRAELRDPGTAATRGAHEHGQRDERDRIRAACIEMKHHDGCACDVIDTLNRIAAIKGEQ
jgi:hypothetical protein